MTLLPGPFWLFLSRAHQGLLPFTLKHSTPRARHPLPSKSLDPMLEGRVRAVLQTVAPELSPRIRVGWNRLMRTTAGVAVPSRWEIWLNPALREISEVPSSPRAPQVGAPRDRMAEGMPRSWHSRRRSHAPTTFSGPQNETSLSTEVPWLRRRSREGPPTQGENRLPFLLPIP